KFSARFVVEWCHFARAVWINNSATSHNGVTAGSSQMFSEFAEQNGLTMLHRFLKLWIPGMGYGTNESNYTFRILNYMGYTTPISLSLGSMFNHHLLSVRPGYQTVVEEMVKDKDIRLGVKLNCITRNKDEKVKIEYSNKSNPKECESLEADLLVLTMSPD